MANVLCSRYSGTVSIVNPESGSFMRIANWVVLSAVLTGCGGSSIAQDSSWKPGKHVEMVVPFAPGTALDTTARTMHSIWMGNQWLPASSTVMNKPGGGGTLGFLYLTQHPKDAHYLAISSPTLLTNSIIGASTVSHKDLTPIAIVLNESTVFAVKADSPIRSGRDLVQRLQKAPGSLSISIGSALGNSNHIALAMIARASGIDVKRLKVVPFASAGAGMTALLGGHVDVAVSSMGVFVPQVAAGTLRLLATGETKRLTGKFADVPTWQENGVRVEFGSWRAIFAPKDIPAASVDYWEQLIQRTSKHPEWLTMAEKRQWQVAFSGSRETAVVLEQEFQELKAVLGDLGMAK